MILIIEEGVIIALLALGFVTLGMKMYKSMKPDQHTTDSGLKTINQGEGEPIIDVRNERVINVQPLLPLERG
jgi:hypothetical protein